MLSNLQDFLDVLPSSTGIVRARLETENHGGGKDVRLVAVCMSNGRAIKLKNKVGTITRQLGRVDDDRDVIDRAMQAKSVLNNACDRLKLELRSGGLEYAENTGFEAGIV